MSDPMQTLNPALAKVPKRLHYPLEVILTCARWYVAYPLSLRHLEEMLPDGTHVRSSKYLNNVIEQDLIETSSPERT